MSGYGNEQEATNPSGYSNAGYSGGYGSDEDKRSEVRYGTSGYGSNGYESTPDELLGYRDVLWQRRHTDALPLATLDIVGTGGVKRPRYNTSTTVAIVLAALGIKVAKHGNRGSRQANGSFDFLEAIGLSLDGLTQKAAPLLARQGLAFLFARDWHPAFGKIAQARSHVPFPTAFNLLGPLLNPASPQYQIIGTPEATVAKVLADTLFRLGKQGAVVCGFDGLDEVSLAAATQVFWVRSEGVTADVLMPEDFGLQRLDPSAMTGGTAVANAEQFKQLLAGVPGPIQALVSLNAAFALTVLTPMPKAEAVERVKTALESGIVKRFFCEYTCTAR